MDARLKNIMDNYDKMRIGLDDTFRFHCTMCGRCCINREDILLTPRDMYRMAKELEITPREFFDRYCETYLGGDSRMPVVRLKPRGSVQRCPLLKDRKCSVHRAKPTVCALFPIGRCIKIDPENQTPDAIETAQIEYIFSDPGCGDDSETHTVREWLHDFNLSEEDDFFRKWNRVLVRLSTAFCEMEEKTEAKLMNLIWSSTFVVLYMHYDMEKPFLPQFGENAEHIQTLVLMASETEQEDKDEQG